jgi:hypothetical protein
MDAGVEEHSVKCLLKVKAKKPSSLIPAPQAGSGAPNNIQRSKHCTFRITPAGLFSSPMLFESAIAVVSSATTGSKLRK